MNLIKVVLSVLVVLACCPPIESFRRQDLMELCPLVTFIRQRTNQSLLLITWIPRLSRCATSSWTEWWASGMWFSTTRAPKRHRNTNACSANCRLRAHEKWVASRHMISPSRTLDSSCPRHSFYAEIMQRNPNGLLMQLFGFTRSLEKSGANQNMNICDIKEKWFFHAFPMFRRSPWTSRTGKFVVTNHHDNRNSVKPFHLNDQLRLWFGRGAFERKHNLGHSQLQGLESLDSCWESLWVNARSIGLLYHLQHETLIFRWRRLQHLHHRQRLRQLVASDALCGEEEAPAIPVSPHDEPNADARS